MSNSVVEELNGSQAFSSLRSEWQALFKSANASPFLSWEWIACWHQWLGAGKQPYLLCVRKGRNLIGLLPLCREERRLKGTTTRLRRLSFLGEQLGGSDYLDVLAQPGCEQECARLIFSHLAENAEFDLLEFDGIAFDSPSLPWLTLLFGGSANFKYRIEPRHVCPQVRLHGWRADDAPLALRANHFKRCLRRLRRLPDYDYRVITDAAQAEEAFERFLLLHEQCWANRGGSGATGRQVLKDFHRDVVVRLAQAGWLRFEEIWFEGACRASLYGIYVGDRYCFYLSGYDPDWAKYSLGFTLVGLSIVSAAERGVPFYDMLRGAEKYKFDWANEARATVSVQVASNTVPARLAVLSEHAAEISRTAAHAVLPEVLLVWWRRWRRKQALRMNDNGHWAKEKSENSKNIDSVASVFAGFLVLF